MNTGGPMRSLFPRFRVLALAFISLPADATSQQVTGQVLDPERTPISAAEIRFRTENGRVVLRTVSGSEGRFRAGTIEAGRYWPSPIWHPVSFPKTRGGGGTPFSSRAVKAVIRLSSWTVIS